MRAHPLATGAVRGFFVPGRRIRLILALGSLAVVTAIDADDLAAQTVNVTAAVETQPIHHSGDAADDPAIWVHPTDPALSTIIGTDKLGGLAVYDLAGRELQYLPDGEMNNVDLRYGFPLGGSSVALVTAGNRLNDSIAIYKVNPTTRLLENVAARTITTGLTVYGSCMYHSPVSGKFYFIVNDKNGIVEQWELFASGTRVDATRVRTLSVGSITEGCVADDETKKLYIAEELVAIWEYGAEPNAGSSRTQVDSPGGGHLVPDIEGLTIYYGNNGAGYLIASSQGSSEFVIYQRQAPHAYVKTFRIVSGNGIDGVSDTDGIDVLSSPLGPSFPSGLFVTQDGSNDSGNQNFKLVRWDAIMPSTGDTTPPGTVQHLHRTDVVP